MNDMERKMAVATFRFGVISEFASTVLDRGQMEELLQEKSGRRYEIPYSSKTHVARSTILKWLSMYRQGGSRIESLFPKTRRDLGQYRKLDATIRLALKEARKENPRLRVPAMLRQLRHKGVIAEGVNLNRATIYRFLKQEKLNRINENSVDKRSFEAEYPNQIWQSDVMHGPYVRSEGKKRKTYLMAIMDDHSRLIIHAEFYFREDIASFRDCLKTAIIKRGIPQKLYVDNGSCFKSGHLEQISAALGLSITHSRPYTPEGRGKIERWFRTLRDNFLAVGGSWPHHQGLNENLDDWVEDYNNRVHGTTKQTPLERYRSNLECVRPAPPDLIDYFRFVAIRKVKKDRTFCLHGKVYEAPVCLVDRKIELRYHNDDNPNNVEIFFNGMSFENAVPLDRHVNSRIGRNWDNDPFLSSPKKILAVKESIEKSESSHARSGELDFSGSKEEEIV